MSFLAQADVGPIMEKLLARLGVLLVLAGLEISKRLGAGCGHMFAASTPPRPWPATLQRESPHSLVADIVFSTTDKEVTRGLSFEPGSLTLLE